MPLLCLIRGIILAILVRLAHLLELVMVVSVLVPVPELGVGVGVGDGVGVAEGTLVGATPLRLE